ncbi:hypothetical protein EOD39_15526 [Acipenser ruthenus]|uniref:Uncharacterized protein n=1 Tax=Acipenser ruthenus TaxID=7906 RepID=A0A444V858_ACIRT|nr:hypothetical protein EOD39_15526 [Acipenser ruthenus]
MATDVGVYKGPKNNTVVLHAVVAGSDTLDLVARFLNNGKLKIVHLPPIPVAYAYTRTTKAVEDILDAYASDVHDQVTYNIELALEETREGAIADFVLCFEEHVVKRVTVMGSLGLSDKSPYFEGLMKEHDFLLDRVFMFFNTVTVVDADSGSTCADLCRFFCDSPTFVKSAFSMPLALSHRDIFVTSSTVEVMYGINERWQKWYVIINKNKTN